MKITFDDAAKLVQIALTADNGCSYCAANLLKRMMAAFPEVEWLRVLDHVNPDFCYKDLKPYEGDWREV